MLWVYSVVVPLVYNQFQIGSVRPQSDFVTELVGEYSVEEEVVYHLPNEVSGVDSLSNPLSIRVVPQKSDDESVLAELTIKGLVASTDKEAYIKIQVIANKVSQRITFAINRKNVNRGSFQPRIEPLWRQAAWKENAFSKYVHLV